MKIQGAYIRTVYLLFLLVLSHQSLSAVLSNVPRSACFVVAPSATFVNAASNGYPQQTIITDGSDSGSIAGTYKPGTPAPLSLLTTVSNMLVNGVVNNDGLNTTLANYETTAALNTRLDGYLTTSSISSYVDIALDNYVTITSLQDTLDEYLTVTAFDSTIENYLTVTALNNYLTSTVDAGVQIALANRLTTTVDAGVQVALANRLTTTVDAEVQIALANRLTTTVDAEVQIALANRLTTTVDAGVQVALANRLTTTVDAGVQVALANRLTTTVDAGVQVALANRLTTTVDAEVQIALSNRLTTTVDAGVQKSLSNRLTTTSLNPYATIQFVENYYVATATLPGLIWGPINTNHLAFSTNATLTIGFALSSDHPMYCNGSMTLNGNGHIIDFSRPEAHQPVLSIAPGCEVILQDVLLRGLSNQHINLGIGSKLIFGNGCSIELQQQETLTGSWIFQGSNYLDGRGYSIDLSGGGSLWLLPNSTTTVNNTLIQGIGSGHLILDGATRSDNSILYLTDCEMKLDDNYTLTTGGIYVSVAPVCFVTGNYTFTFDANATLTVDGVTAWYDSLIYPDHGNISPDYLDNDHVFYLNNGLIRSTASGVSINAPISPNGINYNSNQAFDINNLISIKHPAGSDARVMQYIDGGGHYGQFARGLGSLIYIDNNVDATMSNMVLKDFSVDQLDLTTNGSLVFGDQIEIQMIDGGQIATTWTFSGNTIVDGRDTIIDLTNGIFKVLSNSTLTLRNVTLTGLQSFNLQCVDNSAALILENTKLYMGSNYSFTAGQFTVVGEVVVGGPYVFSYLSSAKSMINSDSQLIFDYGVTFSYAPTIANRDLLAMTDITSKLCLNGVTVYSTTAGLRLTNGTLVLDDINTFVSDATVATQGISWGNGLPGCDLMVQLLPGARIVLSNGKIQYNNSAS